MVVDCVECKVSVKKRTEAYSLFSRVDGWNSYVGLVSFGVVSVGTREYLESNLNEEGALR